MVRDMRIGKYMVYLGDRKLSNLIIVEEDLCWD